MTKLSICTSLALAFALPLAVPAAETDGAYIISPAENAVVTSPVQVVFGLRNPYGVAPAGVVKENTGHHHLLIDTALPALTSPIPNDEHHRHFGGGQTETTIELAPGTHTLQLLLGDAMHVPHAPPVLSAPVTITVK